MDTPEYNQLLAERAQVKRLLDRTPASHVIDRQSLENRLHLLNNQIPAEQPAEPVHAMLTFRGAPVVGSHGIFADFGTEAVKAFTDVVAAVGASQGQVLSAQGRIPRRDEHRLMITSTATGSFGFKLQETPQPSPHLPGMSSVEKALEQTKNIFEATVASDDVLGEALEDADPRAIESIRNYLGILVRSDAVCAFDFRDQVFRFDDVAQVQRCLGRLSQQNIHEESHDLTGQFLGVLPGRRLFEFLQNEQEEPISGRISAGIEQPDEINRLIGQRLRIRVRSRRVGNGRPRYVLEEFSQPTPEPE